MNTEKRFTEDEIVILMDMVKSFEFMSNVITRENNMDASLRDKLREIYHKLDNYSLDEMPEPKMPKGRNFGEIVQNLRGN